MEYLKILCYGCRQKARDKLQQMPQSDKTEQFLPDITTISRGIIWEHQFGKIGTCKLIKIL